MKKLLTLIGASLLSVSLCAQITERERPAEWKQLVKGGRFRTGFNLCLKVFQLRASGEQTVC